MKKVLIFFFYFFVFFACVSISVVSNGDPFDYIGSDIQKIYNQPDLALILQNSGDSIIVVFSYLNYSYGSLASDFYQMAEIYDQLKKNFVSNKKVKFYRAHSARGFSSLVSVRMPAMHIFANQSKVLTISGKKTKEILFTAIINQLKINVINRNQLNNLKINCNLFYNGGDDGN